MAFYPLWGVCVEEAVFNILKDGQNFVRAKSRGGQKCEAVYKGIEKILLQTFEMLHFSITRL